MADPYAEFTSVPTGGTGADPYAEFSPAPTEANAAPHIPAWMSNPGSPLLKAQAAAPDERPVPQAPSSGLGDVLKSFGSGLVRGGVELAATPITLPTGVGDTMEKTLTARVLADRQAKGISPDAPIVPGGPPLSDLIRKSATPSPPMAVVEGVREGMNRDLHAPETTAGQYGQTVGEFIPAAARGIANAPNAINALGRLFTNAVLPGATSELGGQIGDAIGYGNAGRVIGGLLGGGAGAASQARNTSAERAIINATDGTSPAAFDQGAQILANSRQAGRVPLTGAEALQEATQNGTGLSRLMRFAEAAPQGGGTLSRFFAPRPQQIQGAIDTVVGGIAPQLPAQPPNPATVGIDASNAANARLTGINDAINAQTRPLYAAAEPQLVAGLRTGNNQAPGYRATIAAIRRNSALPTDVRRAPLNSIMAIDTATKAMGARGAELARTDTGGLAPLMASTATGTAANLRDIAREAVPEYDQALTQQADLRQRLLNPIQSGPTGDLAAVAPDPRNPPSAAVATPAAGRALLPAAPNVGSTPAYADTAKALGPAGAPLVRQTLAQAANDAAKRVTTGANQNAGTKFANAVAGNPQQEQNLGAVVQAVANPGAAQNLAEVIQNLRATGHHYPAGSPTSGLTMLGKDMSEVPIGTAMRQGPMGLITGVGNALNDQARRAYMGKNVGRLGDILTDPNSVRWMQDILQRGTTPYQRNALGRVLLQSLSGGVGVQ